MTKQQEFDFAFQNIKDALALGLINIIEAFLLYRKLKKEFEHDK